MLTLSYTAGECLDLLLAEANAPDDAAIRFAAEEGGPFFAVVGNLSGSTAWPEYAFTHDLAPDTWHHVALVWGRDGTDMDGYFDGLLRFTSRTNPFFPDAFYDAALGRDWDGLIDEVAMYDQALSDDDIREIFEEGSTNLASLQRS